MTNDVRYTLVSNGGLPEVPLVHPLTFGRAPDNTVVLSDLSVPSYAARVEPTGDGWCLIPIDEAVAINGIPLERPTRLVRGDRIRLGRHQLTFTERKREMPPPPRSSEARTSAHDKARAQMAWGYSLAEVRATLTAGGYTPGEIERAMSMMMREERAVTRAKGVRQLGLSIPPIVAGLAIQLLLGRMGVNRPTFALFGLVLVIGGVASFVSGLHRLVVGGRERHDIAG